MGICLCSFARLFTPRFARREQIHSSHTGKSHELRVEETFEANVRYDLRYMVDHGLHGCQWVTFRNVQIPSHDRRVSRAQIEVYVEADDTVPLQGVNDIAPVRWCSYDIECIPFDGQRRFPQAANDPIICISCHVEQQGQPTLRCSFNFGEGDVAPVEFEGNLVIVYNFPDERDMLLNFAEFIRICDPDVITGYNIETFDNRYVIDRAEALGIALGDLSRQLNRTCKPRKTTFKSRAQGTKESYSLKLPGRVMFDLCKWLQKKEKLKDYRLNTVAKHYIGDEKEDVPPHMIYPLYKESPAGRARITKYCYKDAKLPMDIIKKQLIFVNNVEMVRVVGVPISWLVDRGEQAKTQSKIMRAARPAGYLIPTRSPEKRPYQGAIVKVPAKGFYTNPIVVLDAVSLYPSIMIAYNLCYTTAFFLKDAEALGLKPDDYNLAPPGHSAEVAFVKPHIRKGLLPLILEQILAARRVAKADMNAAKKAGNVTLGEIMDGRQLALKITANSVYGYTSANQLSFTYIAERVCQFGRMLITFTTEAIQSRFNTRTPDTYRCIRAGIDPNWDGGAQRRNAVAELCGETVAKKPKVYSIFQKKSKTFPDDALASVNVSGDMRIFFEADSHVIYGDTDSVMINFGNISIPRSQDLGREASVYLKPFYVAPLDFIWEKSLCPMLLEDKKRYAGGYWTRPDVMDRIDCKGIETQRRDWTGLCTDVLTECLHQLMIHTSKQGAIEAVHKACADVLMGRIDISKLILTKGYTKTLAEYESGPSVPVHIQVVKNAIRRDPVTAPRTGDRVSYVMVDGVKRERNQKTGTWGTTKTSERAEDPLYVMQSDIPIDGMWYVMNQLMKPCVRLMNCVLCTDVDQRLDLDGYYEKHPEKTVAYKILFTGPHMMQRVTKIRQAEAGKMTGFVTRLQTCLTCRVPLRASGATCENPACKRGAPVTVFRVQAQMAEVTRQRHEDICVRCQKGTPYKEILCENKQCENWYQRFKAKKHAEETWATLMRFRNGEEVF
jgi:DNA polymerase elongation subunit (family B)